MEQPASPTPKPKTRSRKGAPVQAPGVGTPGVGTPGVGTPGKSIVVGDLIRSYAAIGDGAQVIIQQARSAAEEAQALEDYAGARLAQAVAELASRLYTEATVPRPASGSPYKYLLPYELSDAPRFFGREAAIRQATAALACDEQRCRFAILHGDAGMGKTSLLRAGIAPALVAGHHLPLVVRVTGSPLAESIKQTLLPDLSSASLLESAPLPDFIHRVARLLPPGKHLFVLLDQFEVFFESPAQVRQEFVQDLAACLAIEPACHWMLSLRSNWYGHLETFRQAVDQPFANSLVVSPLTQAEARSAILEPAHLRGLSLEPELLETLLDDLGCDAIDPSRLQLVCHTLVEGLSPGQNRLTLAAYQQSGGAAGALRDHLDLVLERNLPLEDREPGWRLLAALADERCAEFQSEAITADLQTYGIPAELTQRLLQTLVGQRLVNQSGAAYSLASPSLLARIQVWERQRAAIEQARDEARRQLNQVRDSALRGLLGGALGFSLAYLMAFWNQVSNPGYLPLLTLYRALPGALAGLLLILFVDVARASYHGRQRRLRYLVGALAGAGAFSLALAFHTLLNQALRSSLASSLVLSAVQGALWGAAAGLAAVWVQESRRPAVLTLPLVVFFCGLVLWATETFGQAFHRPDLHIDGAPAAWQLLLAGAVLPTGILAAAMISRSVGAQRGNRTTG